MEKREEVFVTDLYKKHKGKELFKGFYTVGKRTDQDDGKIIFQSIALDREALKVLRAKIMAIFIEDTKSESMLNLRALNPNRQGYRSINSL